MYKNWSVVKEDKLDSCGVVAIVSILLLCFYIAFNISGCKSTPRIGADDVVEARLIAERLRARDELAQQLREHIEGSVINIEQSIDRAESGLAQVRIAAEEYRRLVLGLIDELQRIEAEGRDTEEVVVDGSNSSFSDVSNEGS